MMAKGDQIIDKENWEAILSKAKVKKADMNRVILDFFLTEGYVEAAGKFRDELGTISELERILEDNPLMIYNLMLQQLLDMIKAGKIMENVEFAQEKIIQTIKDYVDSPDITRSLEIALSLLLYEDPSDFPYPELLTKENLVILADDINECMLTTYGCDKDSKLVKLLKMLGWVQDHLNEDTYPRLVNLRTAALEEPPIDDDV